MDHKQLMSTFKPAHLVLLTFAISFAFFVTSVHASAIHHWSFDESDVSGAEATDVIGGNTATLIDVGDYATQLPPDGDAMFMPTGGAFGGYFREPDDDDQALLSRDVSFVIGQEWTVALWINRRGSENSNPAIISPIGNNADNSDQIRLRRNFDQSLAWEGEFENTVQGSVGSGILPTDAWVHIAAVSDGSSVILYRDGIGLTPQVSKTTDTGWMFNSIGKGKKSGGQSQGADIDEVWVFDEALSAIQIDALMNFNAIEIDSDGDGVADEDDNCPLISNADQVDSDGDSEGDACETDVVEEETTTTTIPVEETTTTTTTVSDNDTTTTITVSDNDTITTTTVSYNGITTTTTVPGGDIFTTTTISGGDTITTTILDEEEQCTDNDGDGYYAEGGDCGEKDCDDNDALINSGSDEVCDDGMDNNCNGEFNEDCDLDCKISNMSPQNLSVSDGGDIFFITMDGDDCSRGMKVGQALSRTVRFVGPDGDDDMVEIASLAFGNILIGLLRISPDATPGVYYVYLDLRKGEVSGASVRLVE